MDPKDQPPARDPATMMNLSPPEKTPEAGKPADPAPNPNIPPPPPGLLLNANTKPSEADPLLDAKLKKPDEVTKPKDKKKPNFFDDLKNKLLGTNKQEKVKENQGLEEFDFTNKFQKLLFDQPMTQFRNYLLDEPVPVEQASKPVHPEPEIGPQLPPMAQPTKPENQSQQPQGESKPPEDKKPLGAESAAGPQQDSPSLASPTQPGLEAHAKPAVPTADRVKLPRFLRRIDLNFQMRPEDSYLAGVNQIITSPNGKYAIVNCDYYQSFLFINLKQPGDRYLGKKENWDISQHLKWLKAPNNLYLPTRYSNVIPIEDLRLDAFKPPANTEEFSMIQKNRSHALFFPDSTKIAVLDSDRLQLSIYDSKEVAKSGWRGEKSLIKAIRLLDVDQVKSHGQNPDTNEIFGMNPDDIDHYGEDASERRCVTITYFYFEKLSAKGGYFEPIEQDVLMIGTFYGYIRIVFPKAGFFTEYSQEQPTEEDPPEDKPEKDGEDAPKPIDKKVVPQPDQDRWFTFFEECIQCFAPTYVLERHKNLVKPNSTATFFNNNSGSYGWVVKDGNVKTITSYQIVWKHFSDNDPTGSDTKFSRTMENAVLSWIKPIKLGPSSSVFCESVCPGPLGILSYDNKKYEISRITNKGIDSVFRLGKKTNVKTVIQRDDCKVLLIIDENGKANFYMNFNKSYILLDSLEMKLENFQGKRDEVVGMSHYFGNVSIADDYSAVVFANNSSLFVYDLDIPAPTQRYFIELTDEEARPFTTNGPNWFMLRSEDLILGKAGDDGSTHEQEYFTFNRVIDLGDQVKVKALPTNIDYVYWERNRLRNKLRDGLVAASEEWEEQEAEEDKEDSDSQKNSDDNRGANQPLRTKIAMKYPKPMKKPFLSSVLFDQQGLFPIRMGDTAIKREETSDKTLGNEDGIALTMEQNEANTQFVPGFPHLELVYWESTLYRRSVVVGLRDYSTCKPAMANGAFSPPTTKWELFFESATNMGAFEWEEDQKGAFFKFDPTGTIGAFQVKRYSQEKHYTYVVELATGKVLTCLPAYIFSQVVSATEVILAVQVYDSDNFAEPQLLDFFKEFLQPRLIKYLQENRKKKPVFVYNFVQDQITELWTIENYSQQPVQTSQQAPYMFYNSHMLPIIQMPAKPAVSEGKPQAAAVLNQNALLVKSNLICLFKFTDLSVPKPAAFVEAEQIWPVRKIQKLWEDSSKKVNLNAQIKDGSVVFSPGNLWMAYYDESTLDAVRLLWTPSLDFARFVHPKFESDMLRFNLKGIRTLRMCFSDDNKYFVIKAGKKLTLFELKPPEIVPVFNSKKKDATEVRPGRVLEISDIEISELASTSNVVSMKFRNGMLDLAFVRDMNFFFESIPFDFNPKNLYLKSVRNRLLTYQNASGLKDRQKASQEIATIMMEQPIHQKFTDSTYFKILCAFKRTNPLREYLNLLVKVPHIIFKHSPYKEAVEYTNINGATNRVIECLIDFVQKCVEKNNELPIYDTDVLLGWLRQKQIEDNNQPESVPGKEESKILVPIKISIQYKRKLLELITLAPTQRSILGELKDVQMNVTKVECAYSEKEKFPTAIEKAKNILMDETSANSIDFNSFFTAFPFDLNNGSRFSLDYFAWLEDVSDEDLVTKYAGIIYYKWSLVLKPAVIYSLMFWLLNAGLCAFMGFSYKTVWLGAILIVLHCMFILYEFKCYLFAFIESIKDPWNYVDIVAHLFSLLSVGMLINFRNQIDNDPHLFSQLSWLRMVSFTFITFRGLGLFRIFSGTRYLIVMIFAVFKEIAIFLSVFGYMIFIYWFVCLIRPSLVPGGEDETFYNAITQSLDIAFSNFSGANLSWIVLISTVLGQVILGLVLLNYLIAIVSKTHEKVSERRSLYDIRILLTIIKEFDSFFYVKRKDKESIDPATSNTYITVIPLKEQTIEVKKLKEGLRFAEGEQGSSKLLNELEFVKLKVQRSLHDLEKKIEVMGSKLDIEVRQALRRRKYKQMKVMEKVPTIMEECMDTILKKVNEIKLNAEAKGQKSAEERARIQIAQLEAQAAARESQKKLDEASKEASRMVDVSSDEDEHESMEQIDEEPEDDQEESGEEHNSGDEKK